MTNTQNLQLVASLCDPLIPHSATLCIKSLSSDLEIDSLGVSIEKLDVHSINFLANRYRQMLFEKVGKKDLIKKFIDDSENMCYTVGTHKEYKKGYEDAQKYIFDKITDLLQLEK